MNNTQVDFEEYEKLKKALLNGSSDSALVLNVFVRKKGEWVTESQVYDTLSILLRESSCSCSARSCPTRRTVSVKIGEFLKGEMILVDNSKNPRVFSLNIASNADFPNCDLLRRWCKIVGGVNK